MHYLIYHCREKRIKELEEEIERLKAQLERFKEEAKVRIHQLRFEIQELNAQLTEKVMSMFHFLSVYFLKFFDHSVN